VKNDNKEYNGLKTIHNLKEKKLHDSVFLFSVTDSGIGIPENKHVKIFERFIQVDSSSTRKFEGSGLGLSIAKAYVEMLGGKLWLESEVCKGSTFYFEIPFQSINGGQWNIGNTSLNGEEILVNRKLKILVAEDDFPSFVLIRIAVKLFTDEIIHVRTGVEAIEFCRQRSDLDLIMMDIKMPDMDGYEATRRIRQFSDNVIIIAQTAYALPGDHEKALAAGCNDYLSKPINRDQLQVLLLKYFFKRTDES
jgi:CheY-like chemotaxis protein